MQADKVEERWTPSKIEATFALRDLPACTTKSRHISILLPLLNHGWTFALSLAPERVESSKVKKVKPKPCSWVLAAISFRQHDTKTSWVNTSMEAQLSLEDPKPRSVFAGSNIIPLGTITVLLAHTPSAELPVASAYTLASDLTTKVLLTLTVKECPFANGLFQTQPLSSVSDTEAQTELFRQSGDRVLSRSLATGRLFDVKFLSSPTRLPFSTLEKLFPTYASLSVLEKYVSLPDSKLADGWTAAFKGGNTLDPAGLPQLKEISCSNEYDYELDSDFEDDAEPGVSSPPSEPSATGKQPDRSTARSSGSLSSFDMASDQGSVGDLPEEIIQDSEDPSHLFSSVTADCERTVLIKFAAHRTWHAFLWYCYTGHVEFNELKSQNPGVRRQRAVHTEDGPPTCSPKSMFRLADLVGNQDLKEKSLQAIRERMTEANVLPEVFSIFTSKYPNVRELQLSVLMEHCASLEVKKTFLRMMMKYSSMPHAEPVLSAFYDQLVQ